MWTSSQPVPLFLKCALVRHRGNVINPQPKPAPLSRLGAPRQHTFSNSGRHMHKYPRMVAGVGVAALLAVVSFRAVDGQTEKRSVLPARAAPNDVEAVWAREEAYWRFVAAGDVDNYRTLWNRDFRGWPCAAEHPATKATIGDWVREIRDQKIRFTYSLMREGAANVGGVVVVYYRTPMIYQYADGKIEGAGMTRKFTHTWMKVNGTWEIIGGMCGADAPRA